MIQQLNIISTSYKALLAFHDQFSANCCSHEVTSIVYIPDVKH